MSIACPSSGGSVVEVVHGLHQLLCNLKLQNLESHSSHIRVSLRTQLPGRVGASPVSFGGIVPLLKVHQCQQVAGALLEQQIRSEVAAAPREEDVNFSRGGIVRKASHQQVVISRTRAHWRLPRADVPRGAALELRHGVLGAGGRGRRRPRSRRYRLGGGGRRRRRSRSPCRRSDAATVLERDLSGLGGAGPFGTTSS